MCVLYGVQVDPTPPEARVKALSFDGIYNYY